LKEAGHRGEAEEGRRAKAGEGQAYPRPRLSALQRRSARPARQEAHDAQRKYRRWYRRAASAGGSEVDHT